MKNMLASYFLLLCGVCAMHVDSSAQDSLKVKERSQSEIGFSFALNYSNIDFESQSYFADSSGRIGKSNAENSAGLALGAFYNIYAGKNFIVRPAAELNILPAKIYYDTDIDYRTYSEIFPVCVELPLMFIYSGNARLDREDSKKHFPEFGIGIRPVIALQTFADMSPTLQTSNINADFSLGVPMRVGKIRSRLEIFYSYGFRNLIGVDESDYKTYTVQRIGRSYAGVRWMLF